MNIVADEHIDGFLVARLRRDGHDVWSVAAEAPGLDDTQVLDKAVELRALLLTFDKDFGYLVYMQGRVHNGVLLIRVDPSMALRARADLVASVLAAHPHELDGAFSVLTDKGLRVRRPRAPLDRDEP